MKRDPIMSAPGRLLLTALTAVCLLAAAAPARAQASIFTVDRNDDPDPATAMACTAAPGDCSLRGAIVATNAAAGPDDISLLAGTYTLTRAGQGEDAAFTDDLDITGDLTIIGAGARSTIVAGGLPFDDRIFHDHSGATAIITGLTITGGKAYGAGGGVFSTGDLTLDGVAVRGNTALDGSAGGGIYSEGKLTIANSTVSGNSADFGGGGLVQYLRTATITNTTISGNKADQLGGGVFAHTSVITVRNSTIVSNESGGLGGGITSGPLSTVFVKSSIVAGNSVDNCDIPLPQFGGAIRSQGNNVSSDRSCPFTQSTDERNVKPRLGPLQDNGGPTDTRALLAGSPALDAGTASGCPAADQRGVARPQGLRCDIGAFERRNRPPVAKKDAYRGTEDKTLRVSARGVLRNDTDPDGDSLRTRVVRRPAKGRLTLNRNGAFSYTAPRNYNGTVRFRYRASDGYGGSDIATVTIRIAARPG